MTTKNTKNTGSVSPIGFRGTPAMLLETAAGASAVVALQGAQLLSWQPAHGREWIYLSERAECASGKPIRGGVPICFPQFATLGSLPRHGLVRTRAWRLAEQRTDDGAAMLVLALEPDAGMRALWPHPCRIELTVLLGDDRIDLELAVDNTGPVAFEFTAALHTYFSVREVEDIELNGLRGCEFTDATDSTGHVEHGNVVMVSGEIDRIYRNVPGALSLCEPERALAIHAGNFPDVVVWNPGPDKCAKLPDMAPQDWRKMICVEAGAINSPVVLLAGESWWGRQTLVDLTGTVHAG